MEPGVVAFLLALAVGYGVFLLYTSVVFGWRGVGPSADGGARRAARHRLQDVLVQAGLDRVGVVEFVAVAGVLFLVGAAVGWALFSGVAGPLALGFAAAWFPVASARARRARRLEEARDAWPRLIEEIRIQAVSLGRSIPQALFHVGHRTPPDMQPAFRAAEREWLISTDFDRTLAVLKAHLADPTADAVCETLLIAHEVGGTDVDRRLGALIEDRILDLQGRKDARAKQAGARFARWFVLVVPLGMALVGQSIASGRGAYGEPGAQLAVLVALGIIALCWLWAGRLMALPAEQRVFHEDEDASGRGAGRAGTRVGAGVRGRGRGCRRRGGVVVMRALVPVGLLLWIGLALLLHEFRWFSRPSLADRLAPYVPGAMGRRRRVGLLSAESFREAVGPLARTVGERVSRVFGITEELDRRLRRVHSPLDVTAFRVRQVGWGMAGLGIGTLLAVAVRPAVPLALVFAFGGALLAFLVLEQQVAGASDRWKRSLVLELPVVAEQVGMLLGSGYSLTSALDRVARRGQGAAAQDLRRVLRRTRHGVDVTTALREWADLADVDAVDRLVAVLALNREATDLGRLIAEEARTIRRDVQRELVELMEKRGQQVWIPVTVATLVPGVIFIAIPFMQALEGLNL